MLNQQLQERLSHLPGVERAALAMYTPFTDNWGEGVAVEGKPINVFGDDSGASWDRVSAGYFETIGQKVLRGRGIEEQDTAEARAYCGGERDVRETFFQREDPMGQALRHGLPAYASSYTRSWAWCGMRSTAICRARCIQCSSAADAVHCTYRKR